MAEKLYRKYCGSKLEPDMRNVIYDEYTGKPTYPFIEFRLCVNLDCSQHPRNIANPRIVETMSIQEKLGKDYV